MPGLASADPHTLSTLSISKGNGHQRGGSIMSPRSMEQVHSTELSRVEQNGNSHPCKGLPPHFDKKAAEESLSLYCKPVELYNIIQRRAEQNPFHLQRCLSYKIEAAQRKRTKIKVTILKVLVFSHDDVPSDGRSNGKRPGMGNDMKQDFQSVLVMLTIPVSLQSMGYHGFRLSQTRVLRTSLGSLSSTGKTGQSSITFVFPEFQKLLLDAKKDGAVLLFITSVDLNSGSNGSFTCFESSVNSKQPILWASISLMSLCQNLLGPSQNGFMNGMDEEAPEGLLHLDLFPSKLQLVNLTDGRCVKLQSPSSAGTGKNMASLQLHISGEDSGRDADKVSRAGGSLFTNWKVLSCSSLPHSRWLQPGQVEFHYHYYFNQLYKSEVTENYSCPFCVVCCSSLKGLRYHLLSTHNLFSFEFLATLDYRVVNVYCRNDVIGVEGNVRDMDGFVDPRLKSFFYWSRSGRHRKSIVKTTSPELNVSGHIDKEKERDIISQLPGSIEMKQNSLTPEQRQPLHEDVQQNCLSTQGSTHDPPKLAPCTAQKCSSLSVQPVELALTLQDQSRKHQRSEEQGQIPKADGQSAPGIKRQLSEKVETKENRGEALVDMGSACVGANGMLAAIATTMPLQDQHPLPDFQPPTLPSLTKAMKNRKDLVERSEVRTRLQLQKRQFYHSHTAQLMLLEQLLSDWDSEDEVDDTIADLEDRRMLNDFVDVTQDEKELMHMWNSFVRRQRVLADGHCPWACEAFAKLHAEQFSKSPALRRCLMLFLIKLWNHHLVDASIVNRSLAAVDLYEQSLEGTK